MIYLSHVEVRFGRRFEFLVFYLLGDTLQNLFIFLKLFCLLMGPLGLLLVQLQMSPGNLVAYHLILLEDRLIRLTLLSLILAKVR